MKQHALHFENNVVEGLMLYEIFYLSFTPRSLRQHLGEIAQLDGLHYRVSTWPAVPRWRFLQGERVGREYILPGYEQGELCSDGCLRYIQLVQ